MTSLKKPSPLDFKTQYGLALDDADDAIIVDLFAGGGGASTGLEMGLGRKVDLAINHNPAAISMHEANHPHAEHLPTDVWGIDPIEATKGATVGWLHASPDCRHHSQAAGGQPRKKEIRDLSWVVVKWAGKLQKLGRGPWVISLENVKQILQWGPLIAKRDKSTGRVVRLDGTVAGPGERVPRHEQFLVPDPKRKGRTWRQFLRALEGFGYHVDYWVERNCGYGDPTTRQRLYLVATDGGFEPVAAEKTHAAKPSKGMKPYRTAAECIDWSDLGQSIRNRKKPLAEATMRRIAVAEPMYTITAKADCGVATAFMVQANGGYNTTHSRPADAPISTITNKGSQQQLATAHLVTLRKGSHGAPVDGPLGTQTGTDHHGLVSALLVTNTTGHSSTPADQPMPTVATGGHHMLVTPEMIAGSLTPEQLDGALWVSAFLMRYHSAGGQWAALDDPLTTITTKDRLALVTVWISGSPYVIVDIRLRMLKPRELYRAQGFPDSYIIERGHNGQRFTLSQQVHMCGNSVSPNTMAAYARANDPWKLRRRQQVAA
ncbi:TPA: DNA cytosine methyltransferase [Pseudomonas aeruginosa]|uniref:DNA cytosine methyltransferase n=1 Tax=Pseudomonas aeruginosa TaxID=287 RepID=UPI000BA0B174|nr:DNA cytosine methyltransferase [Pseudomonas aeruginosa]NPT07881.1 DNA cytosine methyltransferase [Pseudomonas aeruginosa]OZO29813.1 DNA cytosine methyltransferase [Pseudomonas aeruginosa]RPW48125.1 DNA cytosine methyltransferase [Pseudomonas aeruginosa]RUG61787.1 DNA cytosine methyltransferase [Pseudomonas aeruginosa]UTN41729.1 DNA cytosine methyltransferase [Pseudomonas aeruginosa]